MPTAAHSSHHLRRCRPRPLLPDAVRPELPVSQPERLTGLLVSARLPRLAAQLPARVHHLAGVRQHRGLRQRALRRSLSRFVRPERPLPRHQSLTDLHVPRRLRRQSVRRLPAGTATTGAAAAAHRSVPSVAVRRQRDLLGRPLHLSGRPGRRSVHPLSPRVRSQRRVSAPTGLRPQPVRRSVPRYVRLERHLRGAQSHRDVQLPGRNGGQCIRPVPAPARRADGNRVQSVPAVTVRPQQPVSAAQRAQRVLVRARIRGRAAYLPTGVRAQQRVSAQPGVPQPEVSRSVRRHVRHQRPLHGRQSQSDLQLCAGHGGQSVRALPTDGRRRA